MATKILTHNDYTVGWVCVLPKEQTAATAMLDQIHLDLPKPPNDSNTYTLGRVGEHNVVIACLPKGEVGNSPSAMAATRMTSTFPSIKFGLMVGIGGGIPPAVRLGDVVVSTPTDGFGGVVQWDFGKAEQGDNFKRTGSLNSPPSALRTVLTKLETKHEMRGSMIPQHLEDLKTNWPRLAAKYTRFESLQDILFRADYNHVEEKTIDDWEIADNVGEDGNGDDKEHEEEEETNCPNCDRTKVVKRKPREMRVHYGLIASGNQVIKNAAFRDKINKSLGGGVLCFEMEAAGLMNDFPCIVIRGICDYADSHKNKFWQEHAAAVAAAFAKEFLLMVPVHEVDQLPTIMGKIVL
jgi:nucleoside phosphorylase